MRGLVAGTLGDLDWLNWLVERHWNYFRNACEKLIKEDPGTSGLPEDLLPTVADLNPA